MRLGESYKSENYLTVIIVEHMETGFSSPQIQRFTRDPRLFTTSSKNSEIWKTLNSFDS